MLSAYPAGQTAPDPWPICARAVLCSVAAHDIDPASYVRDGTVKQADAEWAYALRPSIAAERSAADANEAEILSRVHTKVDVRLGIITA